jgi:hypothetical protein
VDEARFALDGLADGRAALSVRRAAAAEAVGLAADADARRLLRTHKLSAPLLVRL